MSVRCTSRVWELSKSTGSHRLVLLAIADFANEDGVGWPGQDRLAKMASISVSSTKRVIADLVDSNEIWKGRRWKGGPNAYIVCVGLTEEELERAIKLVVDLGCSEEEVRGGLEPGTTPSTTLVSPTVPPGTTAMDHDPSLSVTDSPSSGLKDKPPPLEIEDDYLVEFYYKDTTNVKRLGTARAGPWEVECYACGGAVKIKELDTEHECQCGMHEFILLSKKPHTEARTRKHEAVEAYYSVYKGRVKHDALDEVWERNIADTVTDIPRWKEVLVAFIDPSVGGSPFSVGKMLNYYIEERLPGTRKRQERESSGLSRFKSVEEPSEEDLRGWE